MKKTLSVLLIGALITSMVGCMGQMGLSQAAIGVNLRIIDNRFGRAAVYILASPVYGVISVIDLFFINSIEFWTGTNPITGKTPAVVDTPADTWMKVDKAMNDVPIATASFKQLDENTTAVEMIHEDGTRQMLMGKKHGDRVEFYLDSEFIAALTIEELNEYLLQKREYLAGLDQ